VSRAGVSAFSYQYLNYRGLGDLEQALQAVAARLPEVELIVGVPRSGILAGSLLALQLNLPLTDVAGYLEGRTLVAGRRPLRQAGRGPRRIVVIDDSVLHGTQLREVKSRLDRAGADDEVLYAAPFVARESMDLVDVYGEVVDPPRIFAWNLLHHRELLARACIDLEGVLCPRHRTDGASFSEFLAAARPLFAPSVPVGHVVTVRPQRHRPEIERWLATSGIEYSALVMLDRGDDQAGRPQDGDLQQKAAFYARSGTDLFLVGDRGDAAELAARSGRQVFAMARREMVYPTPGRALAAAPGPFARSVARLPPARAMTHNISRVSARLRAGLRRVLGR
jgi:orotate phosphoribosyltransferase